MLPSTLPWWGQVLSFNLFQILYTLTDARAHEFRKFYFRIKILFLVGIPLKLAIILPACTFYGIYAYQRDRGLRVTFLERLTREALLNLT